MNADSLIEVWENKSLPDSSRLQARYEFIKEQYAFTNPDTAFVLGTDLLESARASEIKHYEALVNNLVALALTNKGEFAEALEYNQMGLEIAESINDSLVIGMCISDMGNTYLQFGDQVKAYQSFQRGLAINRAIGNKLFESYNVGNIGNIYMNLGNWDKAENYFMEALELSKDLGDLQPIAANTTNLGIIYSRKKNYEKAKDYYEQGIALSEKGGFKMFRAIGLFNLVDINVELEQYDQAQLYLEMAREAAAEIDVQFLIAALRCQQCRIDRAKGELQKALISCEQGNKEIKRFGALDIQILNLKNLYEINKELGNGNQALRYHEEMLLLQDSLKRDEAKATIQRFEFEQKIFADSLKQEEEKLVVEMAHREEVRKKNKTRNYAIGAGLLFLLLAGGFYSRWRYVRRSRAIIQKEKDRSENLLLNILPSEIADELKEKGEAAARDFDMVSILFTDFKEFTQVSEKLSAAELVKEINACFKAFDGICEKYKIEKIKTIGDAYMAAGGLPVPQDGSVKNTVLAALAMQKFIAERKRERSGKGLPAFEMRVGIHTGPVVAGIVGVKKFQYDVWGDTVNTASRLESNGAVGKVNISQGTYQYIKDDPHFTFESRGPIKVKGKGTLEMWFVDRV